MDAERHKNNLSLSMLSALMKCELGLLRIYTMSMVVKERVQACGDAGEACGDAGEEKLHATCLDECGILLSNLC